MSKKNKTNEAPSASSQNENINSNPVPNNCTISGSKSPAQHISAANNASRLYDTRDEAIDAVTDSFIQQNIVPVNNFKNVDDFVISKCLAAVINHEIGCNNKVRRDMKQNDLYLRNVSNSGLPNSCIAKLILAKYDIKYLNLFDTIMNINSQAELQHPGDYGYLAVYQTSGRNAGLYDGGKDALMRCIKGFKPGVTEKDFNEIVALLKLLAPVARLSVPKDKVIVNNGIVNLANGALEPFSSEYVFISKCRVDYNPNALNPSIDEHGEHWDFDAWLASLSDDPEVVTFFKYILGMSIRRNIWGRCIIFQSTVGNNGKGTFCELLRCLNGTSSSTAIPFESFGSPFGLEDLIDKQNIITDENNSNAYVPKCDVFKAVCTGDPFKINRKHKAEIKFKFLGLVVECVNGKLRFADQSPSLLRRLTIIKFDKCFTGREKPWIKQDYLHREEVLQYALKIAVDLGPFTPEDVAKKIPSVCDENLNDFDRFNSPIQSFFSEYADRFVWDDYPLEILYEMFKSWSKANNPSGKTISRQNFDEQVADRPPKGWYADTKKVTNIRKKRQNNNIPEMLIDELNLSDKYWAVYGYNSDRFLPNFKKSYRGFLYREP